MEREVGNLMVGLVIQITFLFGGAVPNKHFNPTCYRCDFQPHFTGGVGCKWILPCPSAGGLNVGVRLFTSYERQVISTDFYMKQTQDRKINQQLVEKLRLSHKEGFSNQEYLANIYKPPKDAAEYDGQEVGIPARKVTIQREADNLLKCTKLLEFTDELVGLLVHSNTEFIFEFGEDLEASLYLALAAHYRQSCAILRFACENALLDSYFELYTGYEDWEKGELFVPSGKNLIDKIFPEKYKINDHLKQHIMSLSQYVHFKSKEFANPNLGISYDSVYFEKWHTLFIDSAIFISQILLAFHFEHPRQARVNWLLLKEATGIDKQELLDRTWVEHSV